MDRNTLKPRPRRRSYTPQFKAELVSQCLLGQTSLASLAVEHGINPNILGRWVLEHKRDGKHGLQATGANSAKPAVVDLTPANWIPIKTRPIIQNHDAVADPSAATGSERDVTAASVDLELVSRGLTMTVRWPISEHEALAHWTRELLK